VSFTRDARAAARAARDLTDCNRVIEQALIAALTGLARRPTGAIVEESDVIRLASGTAYASFNNVLAARFTTADPESRVTEIMAAFAPHSVPLTWWTGPLTKPADLGQRLVRMGLVAQEPEFGMILDLAEPLPPIVLADGTTIEVVADPAAMRDWTAVMAAAYGWTEPGKAELIERANTVAFDRDDPPERYHFVVRLDGAPVACSTLFVGDGSGSGNGSGSGSGNGIGEGAFVTNIGTVPSARGRGFGTLATLATLETARSTGYSTAVLAASVDGRALYLRLGFREYGRLDRYVASAGLISSLVSGVVSRQGPRSQRRIPA
jgi:ribosomal protein S18 acetylase RimI-like enzyme